jgi:hypothetical protein
VNRDSLTGRFLPGNQIARGNRGNRKAKWGNKNALKHGLFGISEPLVKYKDGKLQFFVSLNRIITIDPKGYFEDERGRIWIRNDVANELVKLGVKLLSE